MNIFQLDYFTRLQAWRNLRDSLQDRPTDEICEKVDHFWQQTPISNHYLHPSEINKWPDPWQLLDDNVYCPYARAYGMIVTLFLLGIDNVELADCKDYNGIDVVLVLVDQKYVLNYWPNTVVNNNLTDFKVIRTYDLEPIKQTGKI